MKRAAVGATATILLCCGGATAPVPPPPTVIDVVIEHDLTVTTLPGPPLPTTEGCVGDEIVRPRGNLRLLGQLAATSDESVMVSSTDNAIAIGRDDLVDAPFIAFDRATGTTHPITPHEKLHRGITSEGWVYGNPERSPRWPVWGGPLGGSLNNISSSSDPRHFPYQLSAVRSLVGFIDDTSYPTRPYARWHDVPSNTSGAIHGCLIDNIAVRASTLIAVEGVAERVGCATQADTTRVHFLRGSTDSTVSRTLNGFVVIGVTSFDATAHFAFVVDNLNAIYHRDGTIELDPFPKNVGRAVTAGDYVFGPVPLDDDVEGSWEVRELHLPDHVLTRRGVGSGKLRGNFHDRQGAYWVSYKGGSYYLWTIDFDFLGCPSN